MASAPVTTEVDGRTLTLTNLEKVLYPHTGFSKAEVIAYYLEIAPVMLPYLADRCLTRVRFPHGVDGASFYEKNAPAGVPQWVRIQQVLGSEGPIDYVVADQPATLVYLANLAALELHAPQWTTRHATFQDGAVLMDTDHEPRATHCVVDLDPGPGIEATDLSRAALLVATRLAADGLDPYVKTTGSKGLQVSARIEPTASEHVVSYVRHLAADLSREYHDLFVATMAKSARDHRIYVDYLQNKAARNTICPYSLRARQEPWVATPVTWDEVAAVTSIGDLQFTTEQVMQRVDELGDIFAPILSEDGSPPLPTRSSNDAPLTPPGG